MGEEEGGDLDDCLIVGVCPAVVLVLLTVVGVDVEADLYLFHAAGYSRDQLDAL